MWDWFSTDWLSWQTLRSFVWADKIYLYGIAGIPFLFLLRWLFYNRGQQKLGLSLSGPQLKTRWVSYLRFLPPLFFILGIAFILISMARPQRVRESKEQFSEGIDIMLAMDISDSMLEKDLNPNRLDAAKNVAREFIKGRFQDRIGLVIFAGESYSICPLTTDYDLLNEYLNDINSNMIKTSGTAIGSALATCINRLRDVPGNSKVAILLSDGDNTAGNLDPITATDLAKSFGIRIYTILVGRDSKNVKVDESSLREIAKQGNGQFFRATDNQTLKNIFGQINRLEKVKIKDNIYRDVEDFYYIYLNWAIVFLLTAFFFKNTFVGNILED
ncbi:vWA domain-containing protein [Emticicia sp. 17c]|uniref:vWA domain-containing protein n=1 Tax=Emticicia sp. 17c TaxID=3127704 RepID=UPI00301E3A87